MPFKKQCQNQENESRNDIHLKPPRKITIFFNYSRYFAKSLFIFNFNCGKIHERGVYYEKY